MVVHPVFVFPPLPGFIGSPSPWSTPTDEVVETTLSFIPDVEEGCLQTPLMRVISRVACRLTDSVTIGDSNLTDADGIGVKTTRVPRVTHAAGRSMGELGVGSAGGLEISPTARRVVTA